VDVSFDSFSEFLSMGGHGLYVWLSYALGLILILINLVGPLRAGKRLQAQLTRRLLREKNR
jgi:heme exporter protein D